MSFSEERSVIIATCPAGASDALISEMEALGYPVAWHDQTMVEVRGTLADTMRMNMHLRTAYRVYFMVGEGRPYDLEEFEKRMSKLPWELYVAPGSTFSVEVFADHPAVRKPDLAMEPATRAILARLKDRGDGIIPEPSLDGEGLKVFVHWTMNGAAAYIDTTGEPLSRRGYRIYGTEGALREPVAAAALISAGWGPDAGFLANPMCGAGTIAIEAAWIAQNRAPGLARDDFAFMEVRGFDMEAWREIRREAVTALRPIDGVRIAATDVDHEVVEAAKEHAEAAGVAECISFDVCDVLYTAVPDGDKGLIIANPPLGSEHGDAMKHFPAYEGLGKLMDRNADRAAGFIITESPELARRAGIKSEKVASVYNGQRECAMMRFLSYSPRRFSDAIEDDAPLPEDNAEVAADMFGEISGGNPFMRRIGEPDDGVGLGAGGGGRDCDDDGRGGSGFMFDA